MSREIIVADLVRAQGRELKMPGLSHAFADLARQARAESWSFEDYLHEVLSVELTSRRDSAVRSRLRAARFPELKTLDAFDFTAAQDIDAGIIADLARGQWLERGDNVVFAGPIGTGKTHLAIALGIEAVRQKKRVAFHRAADLVRDLIEARDEHALGRLHKRVQRADLLVLDEVGFVPFERHGGELLFNLLAHRYERRRSVIVTTNLAFAEWPKVFGGDEKLTTALLDRLAERAVVITPRGKSYRMRRRNAAAKPSPTASAKPTAPKPSRPSRRKSG